MLFIEILTCRLSIFSFTGIFWTLDFCGIHSGDTHEIIGKAHLGGIDYVKHSLTLFIDFVVVLFEFSPSW